MKNKYLVNICYRTANTEVMRAYRSAVAGDI